MPLVSVVISAKDAENTLAKSLKSALQSDFPDFEVVLVDDGSTDKTWEIARSIQEDAKNLRVIRNSENLGLSASLNKAIASCDCKYIARLDADDLVMRNRLSLQAELLDKKPSIGICGSGAIIIDDNDKPISISPPKAFSKTLFWASLWRVPFFHPSVFFRRNIFEFEGISYDENDRVGMEDYQLWSQVLERHQGHNFIKPLIFYRRHAGQITHKKTEIRKKSYYETCRNNISKYTGEKFEISDVENQLLFSFGGVSSDESMSKLKQAIEFREMCAVLMAALRPDDQSIEIGFGMNLINLIKRVKNGRFNRWLMSSKFRNKCICNTLQLFPSYSYYKIMKGYWASYSQRELNYILGIT